MVQSLKEIKDEPRDRSGRTVQESINYFRAVHDGWAFLNQPTKSKSVDGRQNTKIKHMPDRQSDKVIQ